MLRARTNTSQEAHDRNEGVVVDQSKIQGGNHNGSFFNQGSSNQRALEVLLVSAIVLFIYFLLLPYKNEFDIGDEVYSHHHLSSSNSKSSNSLFQKNSYDAPTSCYSLSKKEEITYTLVIHSVSLNQLWHMKYQCKRWNGPISLAVYTNQTESQIQGNLVNDFECNSKKLTVSILNPTTSSSTDLNGDGWNTGSQYYFPENALRNVALASVETTHVMIIDIDIWVSENLYSMLQSPLLRMTMLKNDHKFAFVIPSFQIQPGVAFCQPKNNEDCKSLLVKNMPRNKQAMNEVLKSKVLVKYIQKENKRIYDNFALPYMQYISPLSQNSTNYTKWYTQAPSTMVTIPCVLSDMYVPFLALRYCTEMPPFQESIYGYGQTRKRNNDKISWMLQLRKVGYTFSQVGGAFVVQFPHHADAKKIPSSKTSTTKVVNPSSLNPFRKWLEETYDPNETKTESCNQKGSLDNI